MVIYAKTQGVSRCLPDGKEPWHYKDWVSNFPTMCEECKIANTSAMIIIDGVLRIVAGEKD